MGTGKRTCAGAIVSVVILRIRVVMENRSIKQSVSEKPQPIPVESISLASGS